MRHCRKHQWHRFLVRGVYASEIKIRTAPGSLNFCLDPNKRYAIEVCVNCNKVRGSFRQA